VRLGRILALDFGTKRVGAALSDPSWSIASPLETYARQAPAVDARHYQRLIQDEGITRIVVGLPVHTSGRPGVLAALARSWGEWLREVTALPVVFVDERYTSVEAEEALRGAGLKAKGRKDRRDMIAATILLQGYLDSGAPEEPAPVSPLDDERS
jgi:putative Holliday junction resolvase